MKLISKKINYFVLFDFLILGFIAVLTKVIRSDLAFLVVFLCMPLYIIISKRKSHLILYFISVVQAAIWILVGNSQYGYNVEILVLGGINVYPFLMWAVGLFLMYLYAEHIFYFLKIKKFWNKLVVYTLFFWFALITFETLAYHVFFIRNAATSVYAGLPLCDCIHAPTWMQIVYLTMGPVNFIIQTFVKNISGFSKKLYITKKKRVRKEYKDTKWS